MRVHEYMDIILLFLYVLESIDCTLFTTSKLVVLFNFDLWLRVVQASIFYANKHNCFFRFICDL